MIPSSNIKANWGKIAIPALLLPLAMGIGGYFLLSGRKTTPKKPAGARRPSGPKVLLKRTRLFGPKRGRGRAGPFIVAGDSEKARQADIYSVRSFIAADNLTVIFNGKH